jgi:N-methylhydantoinase B
MSAGRVAGDGATVGDAQTDPIDLAVMSSRFDSIVREMQNTLLRVARSSVIALARDFSCSIVNRTDDLIFSAEGLPVHVYGSGLLTRSMRRHHPTLAPGDAFLHNDPYDGNTHAADHSLLVPVFVDGEHLFTAVAKAHQADIGNSMPTTYMPTARDVYEEGALIFPCVKIQSGYEDLDDIVRMCRRRIRVPDVWYGDYLAMVASCRIAERRLVALCAKFGTDRVRSFVDAWLDYSEQRTREAIRTLPPGRIETSTRLDAFPGLPEGLELVAALEVDVEAGHVTVDLTGNPDCVPIGLNLTEATSKNAAVAATMMVLNSMPGATQVPLNGGTFRCFDVELREGCVAGIPRHPFSCSLATGEVGVRIWAMVAAGFAKINDGMGSAQASFGGVPYIAVISGVDPRNDEPYVTQLICGTAGGPATSDCDGWLSFIGFPAAGLLYRDSIEVDEQKYPIWIRRSQIRVDSEGAGRRRGAPGNWCEYGPTAGTMTVIYSMEGVENLPEGVQGGRSPAGPAAYVVTADGTRIEHPEMVGIIALAPGDVVGSLSTGGGGYGDPRQRPFEAVLNDVREGYVSVARAADAYGVVLTGDPLRPHTLGIDVAASAARAPQR